MDIEPLEWRVPRQVIAIKVAVTAVFALTALWFVSDPARFAVAALATVLSGGYSLRDLLWPVRMVADADGLAVSRGMRGLRHLEWDEIVRIRVDERKRFGANTTLLEIDIDSTLFLFSRHEIGDDPREVAQTLRRMRLRALG